MKKYYVNHKSDLKGHHEVHVQGCYFMSSESTELGAFPSCKDAVTKAKLIYATANGCRFCAEECHTG